MQAPPLNTRNAAREFARRTRRNLQFIESSKQQGAEVHVVTQLTLSLLGLLVFPKEKLLLGPAKEKSIADMATEGWPSWKIMLDDPERPTKSLADIIGHVRNAVAHGRLTFTSDSPRLEEVAFIAEDKKHRTDPHPNWRAEINGLELRGFCLHFLDFIDDIVD